MTSVVPLPGQHPAPSRPSETALVRLEREALAGLEEEAGGRASLVDKLEFVESPSVEEEQLVAALTDPANDSKSLRAVCALTGFSVGKFLAFLQRAAGAQALFHAYQKVYQALPSVAEDAMGAAKTRTIVCGDCDGVGRIKTGKRGRPATCRGCKGEGSIILAPSLKDRELALRLGGMLEGQAPPPAQTVVNVTAGAVARAGTDFAGSHLTRFVGSADKALLGGKSVVQGALQAATIVPAVVLDAVHEAHEGGGDEVVAPLPSQPKRGLPVVLPHGKG